MGHITKKRNDDLIKKFYTKENRMYRLCVCLLILTSILAVLFFIIVKDPQNYYLKCLKKMTTPIAIITCILGAIYRYRPRFCPVCHQKMWRTIETDKSIVYLCWKDNVRLDIHQKEIPPP